ncbi:MFS transporter [Pararhodobacter aggregans]|uniref:Tetracycline resistance MFS efflux pump n=1 Tax=Pararhodobacter aggregans TaxID=404875 RepID=A0A2T7UPI1_9RHOB|nr:MFS transporter [Pararhodobacter aggregans]PTX01194.1 DHA1 family tetracycline resistance protein-like MFS transporter [Pararhodobacter aggregans]PVE46577.1 tetracycline resistance MFS efflux pump [Pararhodobacter aggregans]
MRQSLPVVFILVTLMLDAIGYGLIMPVMPDLIREVTGEDLSHAALWGGLLTGGFAVMQFLFGPVIGNLSDRYGRKLVLLLSLGMLAADYLVLALAGSIWLIFLARLVNGVTSATYGTASAYIADISTPQQKAQRFGLIGAAFGAGFILGPAVGGMLGEFGTRAPFLAAAAVAALNLVFGAFVMRESLKPENRRPFDWRRANPFGAFKNIGRLPGLGRFLTVYFAFEFAFTVYPVIWAYFSTARFGWSAGQVGLSLAYYGLGMVLVQGVLMRGAIRWLGRGGAMALGAAAALVSFSFLTVVESGVLALVLIPISSLSGLINPALRAEMSDRVEASQQGELQGALASLHALGMIVAPFVYTQVFAAFTGAGAIIELPGMVFALPALLSLIALILLRPQTERSPA